LRSIRTVVVVACITPGILIERGMDSFPGGDDRFPIQRSPLEEGCNVVSVMATDS